MVFRIQDATGAPVPWTMIRLLSQGSDGAESTLVARLGDEAGRVSLPTLPEGLRAIDIRRIGYKRLRVQASLSATGSDSTVFTLARGHTKESLAPGTDSQRPQREALARRALGCWSLIGRRVGQMEYRAPEVLKDGMIVRLTAQSVARTAPWAYLRMKVWPGGPPLPPDQADLRRKYLGPPLQEPPELRWGPYSP